MNSCPSRPKRDVIPDFTTPCLSHPAKHPSTPASSTSILCRRHEPSKRHAVNAISQHWSGKRDLNSRPHRPERCVLPNCTTARIRYPKLPAFTPLPHQPTCASTGFWLRPGKLLPGVTDNSGHLKNGQGGRSSIYYLPPRWRALYLT